MDATTTGNNLATVQHVSKKSSDELLRKFADDDGQQEKEAVEGKKLWKRRKRREDQELRRSRECLCRSPTHTALLVERRSLLQASSSSIVTRKRSSFFRKHGLIGCHSQIKPRELMKSKFFFATIQKTWRRTLEGTSKVLLEKHYNRHTRLINDLV